MKTSILWTVLAAGLVLGAGAASGMDDALLTTQDPAGVEVWAGFSHVQRPVEPAGSGAEWTLKGDVVAGGIDWAPLGWFSAGAFAGASRGRLAETMSECGSMAAGGGAEAAINLWQVTPETVRASWEVLVRLEGRGSVWQSDDDGEGDLRWTEWYVGLPVRYKLSHSHGVRALGTGDFKSMAFWAGPAVSKVDGTWERRAMKEDFEEVDVLGAVGGMDIWLIDSLKVVGRVEWFGEVGFGAGLTYEF